MDFSLFHYFQNSIYMSILLGLLKYGMLDSLKTNMAINLDLSCPCLQQLTYGN